MREAIASRRFEILRRVGAGGCGEVYEARDRERGGTVALKTLLRLDADALYRFKQEFRALADVSHPALLPLYELLEEDGTWLFTMELVEGATDFLQHVRGVRAAPVTSDVITRPGSSAAADVADTLPAIGAASGTSEAPPRRSLATVDPDRLRDGLRQLVEGVSALHARGLVHRDLKPSNVLVDRHGRVRVLDFGLVSERAGLAQGISGTPAYMSPEQAKGRPTDAESDWYAVGVMLYEALTGELPHQGPPLKIIVDKQRLDPRPPRELVPDVDPAMERLCTELLARDPKKRPSGARILSLLGTPADRVGRSLPPAPDVLVGRGAELRALGDALDAAERGDRVIVRVHGASGAGKSLLVSRFLAGLGERACVLAGRCFERETVPYAALDGIVDAIARRVARDRIDGVDDPDPGPLCAIFPVLGADVPSALQAASLDPRELRRVAARSLSALARRIASGAPVVLVVDDAHWGDADSVPFLVELARMPRTLLILAHRSELASSPLLSGLDAAGLLVDAQEIAVGPLGRDALLELVTSLSGRDADVAARAERIASESGGNAMLAYELAARTRMSSEPASLDRVIEERVRELSAPARALLEVASVAHAPIDRAIAERAAAIAGQGVAAERALTTLRLVRVSGERGRRRLAPYHDRIREVAASLLEPAALRARHASIAEAYEAAVEATPEILSLHLHGAGLHDRALPHTLAAARRASVALAFDRAVALFARVVEHLPEDHPEHTERLVELADALRDAGRGAEAADVYLRAAPRVPPASALELRRRAVEQLLRSGYLERGEEVMRALLVELDLPPRENRAVALAAVFGNRLRLAMSGRRFTERAERDVDPTLLMRIDTCWAIGSGLVMIDPLRGLEFFGRAVALALQAGEPSRVARGLAHDATFALRGGPRGLPEAEAQLRVARELADRVGDPLLRAVVIACEGLSFYLAGRYPEALDACDRVHQVAGGALRPGWERETLLRTQLKSLYFTGALAKLTAIAEPALELAVERRDLYAEVSLRARAWYLARLVQGDDDLHEAMDASFAKWTGRGVTLQSFFELGARVEIDLYRGDCVRAHERVAAMWGPLERSQILRSHSARSEGLFIRARAAIMAGRAGDARRSAERLLGPGAPWSDGLGELVLALIEPDDGRAVARLAHAEQILEGAGMELFAASARWRRGERVGGDEGRALVQRARARFAAEGIRAPERMLAVLAPCAP